MPEVEEKEVTDLADDVYNEQRKKDIETYNKGVEEYRK